MLHGLRSQGTWEINGWDPLTAILDRHPCEIAFGEQPPSVHRSEPDWSLKVISRTRILVARILAREWFNPTSSSNGVSNLSLLRRVASGGFIDKLPLSSSPVYQPITGVPGSETSALLPHWHAEMAWPAVRSTTVVI